ncbi:hypothetical protein OROHE_010167 [Orobanche hederae]
MKKIYIPRRFPAAKIAKATTPNPNKILVPLRSMVASNVFSKEETVGLDFSINDSIRLIAAGLDFLMKGSIKFIATDSKRAAALSIRGFIIWSLLTRLLATYVGATMGAKKLIMVAPTYVAKSLANNDEIMNPLMDRAAARLESVAVNLMDPFIEKPKPAAISLMESFTEKPTFSSFEKTFEATMDRKGTKILVGLGVVAVAILAAGKRRVVGVQQELELWRDTSKARGFRLSRSKTKYMECRFSENSDREAGMITFDGKVVHGSTFFWYLGSIIQKDGELDGDVAHRIKEGWVKWKSATRVICDPDRTHRLKGKFYCTATRPALLNGTECWAVKQCHVQKMNVEEMRMLR